MKTDINDLIQKLKELLIHGHDMDLDELRYESESLIEIKNKRYDDLMDDGMYGYEMFKEFDGLFTKLERVYQIGPSCYEREPESKLAQELDFGFDYEDEGLDSVDYDEMRRIQKAITGYLAERSVKDPNEDDPDFADVLLKQHPVVSLQPDEMMEIATSLKGITHSIVDYIDYYRPSRWKWGVDLICIAQYLFEMMVEITYKTTEGENLGDYEYDIRRAFTYYQPDVPNWMEKSINASVGALESLIMDAISFIERHDYNKLDYEAWLRPVLYNVGLFGMKFALEQEPQK